MIPVDTKIKDHLWHEIMDLFSYDFGDSSCYLSQWRLILLKMAGGKIHMIPETVSRYLTKQLNSSYPEREKCEMIQWAV
jgi:hypothetical protein